MLNDFGLSRELKEMKVFYLAQFGGFNYVSKEVELKTVGNH